VEYLAVLELTMFIRSYNFWNSTVCSNIDTSQPPQIKVQSAWHTSW